MGVRRRRAPLLSLLALLPLTVLGGCMEGERGYFVDDPFAVGTTTGDPAIDAVLAKLDDAADGPTIAQLTAGYTVLTKLGITDHTATVALDSTSGTVRRSVIVDNVHFIDGAGVTTTCAVDSSTPCVDGLDLARISDVGITPDFYAADTAKRLRRDAIAKLGPTVSTSMDVAGFTASCVDLTLPGGTARYCVLESGMLALLDDGDVRIELTALMELVDPATFVPSGT